VDAEWAAEVESTPAPRRLPPPRPTLWS